jgi:hypothetical protein
LLRLPLYVDAEVAAKMGIGVVAVEVVVSGIDVTLGALLVGFYVVLNFVGHFAPPVTFETACCVVGFWATNACIVLPQVNRWESMCKEQKTAV